MPKLSARISKDLDDVIVKARIQLDKKKGKVLEYFIELALEHPDFEKKNFGNSEEKNCTFDISKSLWSRSADYRLKHRLDTNVSFFRDALARGASKHMESHP